MEKKLHRGVLPFAFRRGTDSQKRRAPRCLPIYQSTTFKYETSEQMARLFDLEESGYFYTRLQNPTNDAVAAKIAALEGGVAGMLTSSGQAASFYSGLQHLFGRRPRRQRVDDLRRTYNLFGVTLPKLGIEVTFVDQDASEEEIARAFRPNTKVLFGETISNPGVAVLDIEKFARIAHGHGVPLIVDNTFATPINCRPIEWGADIVTHSTHQIYGRPCDQRWRRDRRQRQFRLGSPCGQIPRTDPSRRFVSRTDLYEKFRQVGLYHQSDRAVDARPGLDPVASKRFLAEPRTRNAAPADAAPLRQCAESSRILERQRTGAAWVNYCGLKGDKYYDLGQKYLPNGSCGVLSFGLKGGRDVSIRFMDNLYKLAAIVTHVADARTSVLHPASHTHRQLTDEQLIEAGVAPDLIRFSVGIEDVEDIIADIEQALSK